MNGLLEGAGSGIGTLLIILIIAVAVLLVLVVMTFIRYGRLSYRMQVFMRGKDGKSLEKEIVDRLKEIDKVSNRQGVHQADLMSLRRVMNKTLTHYGIIKYDAFDDVGGKLSFALAMLDDDNTGFVLDVIHSRDNCFVYLKEIVKGESYIMLSEEEIEALKQAVGTEEEETI